jgi:hypothetical protein
LVDAIAALASQNTQVDQSSTGSLTSRVTQAIKTAAAQTGVDFSYLMNKASQESSFNPNAQASSSSAKGLFQFTNQTWLQMVKNHGAQYGLGAYASQIQTDSSGVNHVSDPATRHAILALRSDPQVSAEMAGELDKENMTSLKSTVGGKIGATDLYMAHFLGAAGASEFLNTMKSEPSAKAADVLPDAAAANPAVFYTSDGQAKSLSQIYQHFAQKFNGNSTGTMVASAAQPSTSTASTYSSAANRLSQLASSYKVASASTATISAGTYSPTVMSSIKAAPSSLFQTMILAQMNSDQSMSADALSSFGASAMQDQSKKSAIAILGATA